MKRNFWFRINIFYQRTGVRITFLKLKVRDSSIFTWEASLIDVLSANVTVTCAGLFRRHSNTATIQLTKRFSRKLRYSFQVHYQLISTHHILHFPELLRCTYLPPSIYLHHCTGIHDNNNSFMTLQQLLRNKIHLGVAATRVRS